MRLSRRGGLLGSQGVKWEKYACTKTTSSYTYYSEGSWELVSILQGISIAGYTSYTFSSELGLFSVDGSLVSDITSGTVYIADGSTLIMDTISDGVIKEYTKSAVQHTGYTDSYSTGSRIGTVYAAKGTYPDSRRGYIYIGRLTNGYTVMRDVNFNYFAYKEAA